MNEIFFDRPGVLFSDGKIVKLSLQSVQPSLQGEVSKDVALLVCLPEKLPELISILQEFVSHTPGNQTEPDRLDVGSCPVNDDLSKSSEKETSLVLATSKDSHF